MANISETELRIRLRKLESYHDSTGALVKRVGDQYEYTDDYIYLAYASALSNLSAGKITSQQDATDFQFSPYNTAGVLMAYRGFFINRSIYQSGDPTDYTWESTSGQSGYTSSERYYTTSTGLVEALGNPIEPGSGVTWTIVASGTAMHADAVWVAERYTVAGVASSWVVYPVDAYISSGQLVDASVIAAKIADNAVTTAKILNDAIDADKIADDAVTRAAILADAIDATKIADNAVVTAAIAADSIIANKILAGEIGANHIAANAITAAKISADAITSSKILAGEIGASHIAANSLTAGQIAANAITTSELAAGAVTATEIATDAVTANKILADAVTANKIAANEIDATHLKITGTNAISPSSIGAATTAAAAAATAAAATAQGTADGKVTTFFVASPPTAEGTGDLWMDTDDGNKLWRWNGSAWVAVQDSAIGTAISNAATAQSTADGKIITFYATSAPTATSVGDLWIDTDDGNRLYRASATGSGNWVSVRDATIATAQTAANTAIANAATAQGTADGKVTTFFATSAPTAEGTGDLWMDTDDGNKLYRWSSSAWVAVQDGAIATAISNAATAQSTADGKIVTFYQTSAPTATSVGDMWVDTDDKNKLYRASATGTGNWVSVQDSTVADNIYTTNTTTIKGGAITANAITVDKIDLNGTLNVTANSGAVRWGKEDGDDIVNAGLFIGRNSSGNPRFVIGSTNSFIYFNGTTVSAVGVSESATTGVETNFYSSVGNHVFTISPLLGTISIEIAGAGGGGAGGDSNKPPGAAGGTAYVYVKNSAGATQNTYSAAGGAGGSGQTGAQLGGTGASFGNQGDIGNAASDDTSHSGGAGSTHVIEPASRPSGSPGGTASGGGGNGAGNTNQGGGGNGGGAGSYYSTTYTVVDQTYELHIVIPAGGLGGDGYSNTPGDNGTGGRGGSGIVRIKGVLA